MYRFAVTAVFTVAVSAACAPAPTDTTTPATTTAPSTTASPVTTQAPTSTTALAATTLASTPTTEPSTTTTTTQAPTVSTTTTLPGVEQLATGLFCRDLSAAGYTYSEAVTYWTRDGQPDRMDADRNGIPCETVYPHADVVQHWGEPLPVKTRNQLAFGRSWNDGPPLAIVADYAQWFWGDAAVRACEEDGEDEHCPYEGLYYIRNNNPRLRTLELSDETAIFLSDWRIGCTPVSESELRDAGFDEHPTSVCRASLDGLREALAPSPDGSDPWLLVWLITDGETVTAIQEQYVP